jgi:endo-1,4-beta-xylanase
VLPTPPPDFLDVAPSHLFYKDIRWMRFTGITDGFPDNTYRPTLSVTRGSLVQFLYRMAGQPAGPFPNPGYTDVTPAHSFYTAISWAAANDVVGGYPDGSFRPGSVISRQGIAATLYRLAGSPPGPFPDPGFTDVPSTHLFADAIWWAAANDVVGGYPDDTFRPTTSTSRQGMAAVMRRFSLLP